MLAERGAILVCGGRGGVMEAACRGAHAAGGLTIGLLPGSNPEEGNPYLSVAIPTGLGHARNIFVAKAGRAMIAIGGGYGTLSEVAMALVDGRPVIGLETWQASRCDGYQAEIMAVQTPGDAVELALSMGRDDAEGI